MIFKEWLKKDFRNMNEYLQLEREVRRVKHQAGNK